MEIPDFVAAGASCAGAMSRAAATLAITAIALGSAPAWAADAEDQPPLADLELQDLMQVEVVSGASRHEQKVTQAPATVTIVTAAEIRALGYHTLADVLGGLRGIYVSYDHNYSYLGNRGFSPPGDYNSRVLVLVDGHRINDAVYNQAPIGQELPLDLAAIDRIEVIRGPSSSMYGTSAFFAVINLISRRGEQVDAVEIDSGAGSSGALGTAFTLGGATAGGADYVVHGSFHHDPGPDRLYYPEFDTSDANFGWALDADGEQAGRGFATFRSGQWSLRGCWGTRKKTVPTASYGTVFNDRRTHTTDTRTFLEAVRDWSPTPATQAQARVRWDRYEYDGDYIYDYGEPGSPDLVTNRDQAVGEWAGLEAHVRRLIHGKHELLLGTEVEYAYRMEQRNWDREVYLDDGRQAWSAGMYAQGELAVHERWTLNAGLRQDHYETFGGTTNPRIALIHTPTRATTVKFLFGRAFRAPNAYELRYGDDATQKANPSLGPERITSMELDVEHGFGNSMRATASAFRYTTQGLIVLARDSVDSLLQFRNEGSVRAWGCEAEVTGQWGGVRARTSWALQRSENAEDGARLVNSPAHLVRGSVVLPVPAGDTHMGVEGRFTGPRRTLTGESVGSNLLTFVTVTHGFGAHGSLLSAGVKNAFDVRYSDPASQEHTMAAIPQNGRTYFVETRLRF